MIPQIFCKDISESLLLGYPVVVATLFDTENCLNSVVSNLLGYVGCSISSVIMVMPLQKKLPGSGQVLANILFNSTDLLRVDLNGVMILLPQLLHALEMVLTDLTPRFRYYPHLSEKIRSGGYS